MHNNFFTSEIPSFARAEAFDFGDNDSLAVYEELMAVAQEIEQCRASL